MSDCELEWQAVHKRLVAIKGERTSLDSEEADLLVAARRLSVHQYLGYGSFLEYVSNVLGYGGRLAHDRVRVAEALTDLPAVREALREGTLAWSSVRELTRIVVADTENEWLDHVRDRTVRDVERLVAGHAPGDRPGDVPSRDARPHKLELAIKGETLALFREAQAKLIRDTGKSLSEDELISLMARAVLGGPGDEGKASYQMVMYVCEHCGRGAQQGRGERIPVGSEVIAQAHCDCEHIGSVSGDGPERAHQEIPPAVRRFVMARDGHRCSVPGCCNSVYLDVHHLDPRAEGGGNNHNNLACMCDAHHRALHAGRLVAVGTPETGLSFRHADGTPYGGRVSAQAAERATEVYQALRSLGYRETESRWAVAKATAQVGRDARFRDLLDAALVKLRERQQAAKRGEVHDDDPERTVFDDAVSGLKNVGFRVKDARAAVSQVLARADAPRELVDIIKAALAVFRGDDDVRARADEDGAPAPAREADVVRDAVSAMRHLQFSERDARWAVGQALAHVGGPVELDPLIRAALGVMHQARA